MGQAARGVQGSALMRVLESSSGFSALAWATRQAEVIEVAGHDAEKLLPLVAFALGSWELQERLGEMIGQGPRAEYIVTKYPHGELIIHAVGEDQVVIALSEGGAPLGALLHDLAWTLRQLPLDQGAIR